MPLCAHCGLEIQEQPVKRRITTGESRSWRYGKRKVYSDEWMHPKCAAQRDRRQIRVLLFVVLGIIGLYLYAHFSSA
jgi:hypothetical protein